MYEVLASRVFRQVPRSWLGNLDESSDLVGTGEIESWITQDLLKAPVSEQDDCQVAMTAIVMGDVNAVYKLECAHRRPLLAAGALNERLALLRRSCGFIASRSSVGRCLVRLLPRMPTTAGKSSSALWESFSEDASKSIVDFSRKWHTVPA